MKRLALLSASILSLAMAAPVLAQTAAPSLDALTPAPLQYTHRTLDNGLKVYAMPDPTAGTVTVQVWYDVGAKNDPAGRSGFAHLFEHILSRKTINMPLGTMNALTEDVGGARNASTGADFTNYYETVPPQYLETMLWTHAERMARPVVDEAVFKAERDIVKEELRQRVLAPPYGRLQRFVIGDNSYDTHIYRRPTIGSIEDLDSATVEDARAFHEAYYRPSTATLIVSGNFDPAQLDRWVDQYFAPIQAPTDRPVPQMQRPPEVRRTQPRSVVAYAPNVPLPAVAAVWQGVAANSPDAPALEVLSAVLSSGDSSRLHQSLVYGQQLASSAGLYSGSQEEGGAIVAQAIVADGQTPDAVEAALNAELARVREAPVTEAELTEAKTELLAQALRGRETASGRAFILGQSLVSQNDPAAADKDLAAIRGVSAADVQRVARQYLSDAGRVSIRYLDESQRPAGQADAWANPAPLPDYISVPPATRAPNELAPEGQRQAAPSPSNPLPVQAPVIAERTLPNGLRVVVAKSTDLPIVNAQLVIKGGSSADPADRPGLARMTAGLAAMGAGGRSAPEIARALESLGASTGWGVGADSTYVTLSTPVASADAAAAVVRDIIAEPTFAPEELERLRKQSIDGLRVAMRQPGAVASMTLRRVAFGEGGYGSPASGTAETLASFTREQIVAEHAARWRPDNAALVITGGMPPEQGFRFAETLLGDWAKPATPLPATARPARPAQTPEPRVVVVDIPGSGQAAVAAAVPAPARSEDAFYPLSVANAVLGGGSNGRLFQEVRAKRGLSYGAYSSLGAAADADLLSASTQTKNESAAEVVDLILAEFDRVGAEAVAADAVGRRSTYLNGGFARRIETTAGLGGFLAEAVEFGLPVDDVTTYPERIRAVTPQTLQAAAAQYVGGTKATVVVAGDSQVFIEALRAKHPNLVVVPLADLDLARADLGVE
jgi:zinc protease